MKTSFYLCLFILIIFLNLYPYRKVVTGDDVNENIKRLKNHQWFKDYLKDETYYPLIVQNGRVRKKIGSFRTEKLKKDSYSLKCQKKLNKILMRELESTN